MAWISRMSKKSNYWCANLQMAHILRLPRWTFSNDDKFLIFTAKSQKSGLLEVARRSLAVTVRMERTSTNPWRAAIARLWIQENSTHLSWPRGSKMRILACFSRLKAGLTYCRETRRRLWVELRGRDSAPSFWWTSKILGTKRSEKCREKLKSITIIFSSRDWVTSSQRKVSVWVYQSCNSLWCSTKSWITWRWDGGKTPTRSCFSARGPAISAQNESDQSHRRSNAFNRYKLSISRYSSRIWKGRIATCKRLSQKSKRRSCRRKSSIVSATLRLLWSISSPIPSRSWGS